VVCTVCLVGDALLITLRWRFGHHIAGRCTNPTVHGLGWRCLSAICRSTIFQAGRKTSGVGCHGPGGQAGQFGQGHRECAGPDFSKPPCVS
jgi:hypothetical protein